MLRSYMIYFKGNWDDHLSLTEFTITKLTTLASKYLRMRICKGEDEDILLDGLKLVKQDE